MIGDEQGEKKMKRSAGILLPVSSLAGKYGIGDFGNAAYAFMDAMATTGFHIWQILPLNPIGFGNSPYQTYSSYAGDEVYISLEKLKEWGLLTTIACYGAPQDHIDYDRVRSFKTYYFKEAFQRFLQNEKLQNECRQFKKIADWLHEYAIFITFKKANGLRCWQEWSPRYKCWIDDKSDDFQHMYANDIAYEEFLQFAFYKQWFEIRAYAQKKKIQIMGDIPIYVGMDSLDVWANKACFLLTKDGKPRFIAGVPPDYFNENGQRWGNPIYDWTYLSQTHFDFWIKRLAWNHRIFDMIRMDHFRALDTYWKIPASCPTAVTGEWVEAPGYALLDEIYRRIPDIHIIAEDLGDLRPEVLVLRDHYHLSGMKIVQFALDPKEENNNFKERESTILYTGTHDNQTLKGWFHTLQPMQKRNIMRMFSNHHHAQIETCIVRECFTSRANVVIFPLQDLLGFDDRARLNTPGSIGSPNWEWKLKSQKNVEHRLAKYKEDLVKSNRISLQKE